MDDDRLLIRWTLQKDSGHWTAEIAGRGTAAALLPRMLDLRRADREEAAQLGSLACELPLVRYELRRERPAALAR